MNIQRFFVVLSATSFVGCAATSEDSSDTSDTTVSAVQTRVWQRLGAAPVSRRVATENVDVVDLSRPSRLLGRVPAGASVLDTAGGEFVDTPDADRIAQNVALYDRLRAEGPVVLDARAEPIPDPLGVRRNIQGFTDDRTRVSTGSLGSGPYKYIGRYEIPVTTGTISTCTGTLVGSNYVAIAAHCVYDRHDDAWIYGYNSTLGIYRGKFCINSVCANVTARKMSPGWAGASDLNFREHDYALLKLDTAMGTTNGTMGLSSITDDSTVRDLDARNHGYPGTTPDGSTSSATNLWGMHCDITTAFTGRLAYNCDTTGGHSGGPVYYFNSNGSYYVLAVHSGPNVFDNTGARVSTVRSWFIDEMAGW
jgi:V8-like Glu-specific endopeptidase